MIKFASETAVQHIRNAVLRVMLLFAAAFVLCSAGITTAQEEAPEPQKLVLGIPEGNILIQTIRHAIDPKSTPPDTTKNIALDSPVPFPIVVTLYHKGNPRWVQFESKPIESEPTLRQLAENAAKKLATLGENTPQIQPILLESIIEIEVIVHSEPLADARDTVVDQHLVPGIHGVGYILDRKRIVLTPLQLLRHWYKPELLTSAFMEQENRKPPQNFVADRLRTVSYAEETPGGNVLSLYRGNVLVNQPDADTITFAFSYLGRWLIQTQSEQGTSFGTFHPADENTIPYEEDVVTHLRATIALIRFSYLVRAEAPTKAADKSIRHVLDMMKEDTKQHYVYVPAEQNTIMASALMLTTLCQRAQIATVPTADGRMRALGNFLAAMTDRSGRIYARVPESGKRVPFEMRSEVYAEVLLALSLLQQISPTPACGEAADRIVALLSEDRRMPPFPVARTTEAFAQYYLVNPVKKNATRVIDLARRLAAQQIISSPWSDYDGGFARPDMAPDSLTTAEYVSAIATGYEVARALGQKSKDLATAVRLGTGFLVNMQYRPENSFYLSRQEAIRGALRTSPEDLRIRLDANAQSLQALMQAATITAIEFPTPAPEEDAENRPKSN